MSLSVSPKLARYIPLWLQQIPRYPLYYKGDPQLRIHLPLFWMRIIKWDKALPKDTVCFHVHHQMTEYDVKNYLEKIYKVNVLSVRTLLTKGEERKQPGFGFVIQPGPDKRFAFVQLRDKTFEFPNIFPEESNPQKQLENENVIKDKVDIVYQDMPYWFK